MPNKYKCLLIIWVYLLLIMEETKIIFRAIITQWVQSKNKTTIRILFSNIEILQAMELWKAEIPRTKRRFKNLWICQTLTLKLTQGYYPKQWLINSLKRQTFWVNLTNLISKISVSLLLQTLIIKLLVTYNLNWRLEDNPTSARMPVRVGKLAVVVVDGCLRVD